MQIMELLDIKLRLRMKYLRTVVTKNAPCLCFMHDDSCSAVTPQASMRILTDLWRLLER